MERKFKRAKTNDFILKAKRAEYTKLDSNKLEKLIGEEIPSWKLEIDSF